MRPSHLLALATLIGLATTGSAVAQPYPPGPPPPGYGPGGPPPGFDRGPSRGGFHCESFFRTPEGPRRRFCEIGHPQELGSFCECEAPPGFPPSRGHVVR